MIDLKELYKNEPVFLSSPYSHQDSAEKVVRVKAATNMAAWLIKENLFAFSPIAYGVPMIEAGHKFPDDWEFWKNYCTAFVKMCKVVFVLNIPGWEESTGVAGEIQAAKELGIPVYLVRYHESIQHLRDL